MNFFQISTRYVLVFIRLAEFKVIFILIINKLVKKIEFIQNLTAWNFKVKLFPFISRRTREQAKKSMKRQA